MLALLVWLLILGPREAAHVVANPEDAQVLRAITYRESRGRWLSRHKADQRPRGWQGDGDRAARRVGSRAWARAVQAGLLDPGTCPFHERGDARDWSTRGSWGHVAAYAMPYLPCLPPAVLDLPIVSAWVAAKRLRRARRPGAPPALRRWARLDGER
jgi:hypothetical protein